MPGPHDAASDLHPTRRLIPDPPAEDGPTRVVLVPPIEQAAAPPAEPLIAGLPFPPVGDRFLHFELIEEIGRGSFARAYLARQEALANRLVVLKLTPAPTDEPQKLARLQHPNIVPVYSVHAAGELQAMCMPYLGRVTLARLMSHLEGHATGRNGSGRDLLSTLLDANRTTARAPHPDPVPPPPPDAPPPDTLAFVAHLSFVDAALWVVAQLAGGLAHAHARGVLHRDLKPANVLVTDDGVPMILDFNVAADSARKGPHGPVGGTMPYMAPEHVRAFAGRADRMDGRSDLYSLGVILYELLTGRVLFHATGARLTPTDLLKVLAERHALPPPPSRLNPAVSPAVDAITLKLLEPDPVHRYSRAEELREDLTRQLAHRPLKFAPDRSVRERLGKWRRRNPRRAAGLAVAAAVLLFAGVPGGVYVYHEREKQREAHRQLASAEAEREEVAARVAAAERAEAVVAYRAATKDLQDAAMFLGSRSDPSFPGQGLALGRNVLARYAVADGPAWETKPNVARLTPTEQAELKEQLATVLVLMTRLEAGRAPSAEGFDAADRWNKLAAALFPEGRRPNVLGRQRTELDARRAARPMPPGVAERPEAADDIDLYHDGLEFAAAGRVGEALPRLVRYCDRHPYEFLPNFARGVVHDGLGQYAEAAAAFSACIALRPDVPHARLNRGLARLRLRQYADAEADFNRVLERAAGGPLARVAHFNRGLAREGLGRLSDAEAGMTAALADPIAATRYYFARAQIRRKAKNVTGADADRAEGLTREPADADSWNARGVQRMNKEPLAALADFDAALALNPFARPALLNRAVVLADLGRDDEAVVAFTRLLELYPDHVEGRGGRAVSLARLGRVAEAKADAAICLKAEQSGFRLYQMAGVFALVSKAEPGAKEEAIRLLGRALRAGFSDWKTITDDKDVDTIRKDPRFDALISAAKRLEAGGKRPRPGRMFPTDSQWSENLRDSACVSRTVSHTLIGHPSGGLLPPVNSPGRNCNSCSEARLSPLSRSKAAKPPPCSASPGPTANTSPSASPRTAPLSGALPATCRRSSSNSPRRPGSTSSARSRIGPRPPT
jgi:serine/threonine protein kinase/lipoprotein NlpI